MEITLVTCSAIFVAFTLLLRFIWKQFSRSKSQNPFVIKTYPSRPIVLDRTERKKVLKKPFKMDLVPNNLDAIVIGSGMGGLASAGLLSRSGKRVLVLEQHDRIGGGTHTYKTGGFEYDIGIHYVGDMEPGSGARCYIDLLTDGQLDWAELKDDFDTVVIDEPGKKPRNFVYTKGFKACKKRLYSYFPDEEKVIDRFFELLKACKLSTNALMLYKTFPKFLVNFFVSTGLYRYLFKDYDYLTKNTVAQVLDQLTDNKDLKTVLVYSFGDYGALPAESSFLMHGLLQNHFLRSGGYYPKGGASEIAFQMIPGIERSGGVVLAGATVTEVLIENDVACGVRVRKTLNPGSEEHVIRAPIIISAVGIFNTYKSLVPRTVCDRFGVMKNLDCIEPGVTCFQVMVGLNGTKEELGLEAENYWIFTSNEPGLETRKYLNLSREDAVSTDIPLLFLSFPSTKDPTWSKRFPNKTTCAIVTFSSMSWFQEWQDDKVKKRGQVYENLKSVFVNQAWKQVLRLFPHLEEKVATIDGGSPLTHTHYLKSMHGEIYGMHHSKERFFAKQAMNLRPETPIPGLYLSGQDIFTCGFSGAAYSGLVTASKILDRYLINDLMNYTREVRKNK